MAAEEAEMKPELKWVVAGKKGMELHGHRMDNDEKVIVVSTGAAGWTFSFVGIAGAGKVRVGRGTDYNPLQMVESLWSLLMQHEPNTDLQISLDDMMQNMDMTEFSKSLREAGWE